MKSNTLILYPKLVKENELLRSALADVLRLDDNGYLHRDRMDTDGVFERARKIMKVATK